MNSAEAFSRRWGPYALLLLSAALGGLRSGAAWPVFGAGLAAWAWGQGAAREGRIAVPLMFLAWTALAALFSMSPEVSLPVLARGSALVLFFLAASADENGGEGWLAGVKTLGVLAALWFIVERMTGRLPAGFIGHNQNYSAVFIAAAAGPLALEVSGNAGLKRRAGQAALLALLFAALWISKSRSGAAAALLCCAAGLAAERRWRWLGGMAAGIVLAGVLVPGEAWSSVMKLADPRGFQRPNIWQAAISAALEHPFLGWGPGLFGRAFEAFKFPFFDGISYYGHYTLHAHSEPLNIAAEAGFPAAVLFLASAGLWLLPGGKERLEFKLCALGALLMACVDVIFYSGSAALLFWGSLAYSGRRTAEADRLPLKAAAAACLCALGLAALPYDPGAYARAAYAEAPGSPALALAVTSSGLRERPFDPFSYDARGRALAAAGDLRGAAAAFARALELEPFYAGARLRLAAALAAQGRRDEACAALSAASGPAPQAAPENDYQRELLRRDPAAETAIKDICRKKKAGGATAPGRRTR